MHKYSIRTKQFALFNTFTHALASHRPNQTPAEILRAGAFGGGYFRPISSAVTKTRYEGVWKELPESWLDGINIATQVASDVYRASVNKHKVTQANQLFRWCEDHKAVASSPLGRTVTCSQYVIRDHSGLALSVDPT